MRFLAAVFIALTAVAGASRASAQEIAPGAGRVEVSIIPAGGVFFTGNVGAGVKWYSGRWGLRADYRFIGVQSKDDAPAFFGREDRFGHRIYGAVLLNVAR